jgi:hypothetical protein
MLILVMDPESTMKRNRNILTWSSDIRYICIIQEITAEIVLLA